MNTHTFAVGDLIIYGTSGLCLVDSLGPVKLPYDSEPQTYYVLKPVSRENSKIYVPLKNDTLTAKMRPTLKKTEIDAILHGIGVEVMDWDQDKMARHATFHSILAQRDEKAMLLMMRCIYLKRGELVAEGKKMPAADDDLLKSAEKLLEQEFSHSLGIPLGEVARYIQREIAAGAPV